MRCVGPLGGGLLHEAVLPDMGGEALSISSEGREDVHILCWWFRDGVARSVACPLHKLPVKELSKIYIGQKDT